MLGSFNPPNSLNSLRKVLIILDLLLNDSSSPSKEDNSRSPLVKFAKLGTFNCASLYLDNTSNALSIACADLTALTAGLLKSTRPLANFDRSGA